jgi:hypothetical protein
VSKKCEFCTSECRVCSSLEICNECIDGYNLGDTSKCVAKTEVKDIVGKAGSWISFILLLLEYLLKLTVVFLVVLAVLAACYGLIYLYLYRTRQVNIAEMKWTEIRLVLKSSFSGFKARIADWKMMRA